MIRHNTFFSKIRSLIPGHMLRKPEQIKINILHPFVGGPFGGLNQFLKSLRSELIRRNLYAESPHHADIVIYASFFFRALEFYDLLFTLKRNNPNVIFIHRLDGVIRLTRNDEASRVYDEAIIAWAKLISDGIVFQNEFCMRQQYGEGLPQDIPRAIIGNAPDPSFFYPATSAPAPLPWRLVYTSWSSNEKKGFPTLRRLDEELDFSRYAMTFVGSLPEGYTFKNIRNIAPQRSVALGEILRQQHIFVGLSHNETCSNAVLEAMHCGLPALLRNSGGNPEFVPYGGVALYDRDEVIPAALETLCADYAVLRDALHPPVIKHIADRYIEFAEHLALAPRRKAPSMLAYMRFRKRFAPVIPFNSVKFFCDHLRGTTYA